MGCKACKDVGENLDQVQNEILRCIVNENLSSLKFFLKSYIRKVKQPEEMVMNSRIVVLDKYKLNFLAYSLAMGSAKPFKFLYESCRCSVEIMNGIFDEYSIDPLNLICEKNHLELLRYYLPIYFQFKKEENKAIDTTIHFHEVPLPTEVNDMYTPIQIACLNGWIGIVDHLYQYNKTDYHKSIDINEINDYSGESCALISVRSGNIAIVKLLFENYKLDFNVKNKFGECALQICAVCCTKFPTRQFSEVFMYLLEVVGVDINDNHDEILLVLEDKVLITYCENLLISKGIMATKRELEDIYKVKKNFCHYITPNLADLDIKDGVGSSGNLSSIYHDSNETPFQMESFVNGKNLNSLL